MNILCCGAHPDDIELMASGTISRLIAEGHHVTCVVFTNGAWTKPNGKLARDPELAVKENYEVARFLNYNLLFFDEPSMDIQFCDRLVVRVLKIIEENNIDTLILPWKEDVHKDHQLVAQIGIAASRSVSRVLHGQVNYFLHSFFAPNFFFDISDYFDNKINALKLYQSVWKDKAEDWTDFLKASHSYYGKIVGTKMAEGFITHKYLF